MWGLRRHVAKSWAIAQTMRLSPLFRGRARRHMLCVVAHCHGVPRSNSYSTHIMGTCVRSTRQGNAIARHGLVTLTCPAFLVRALCLHVTSGDAIIHIPLRCVRRHLAQGSAATGAHRVSLVLVWGDSRLHRSSSGKLAKVRGRAQAGVVVQRWVGLAVRERARLRIVVGTHCRRRKLPIQLRANSC